MKIICVERNWTVDNKSANSSLLLKEPVVFLKPDSALLRTNHPFFVPDFDTHFDCSCALVVRISRLGKDISPRFAHRYYDQVSVGVDFTARQLYTSLLAESMPWSVARGFDGSAACGQMVDKTELADVGSLHFSMSINDEIRQTACTADMHFAVDDIIAYASRFFTLKMGDLIYTGALPTRCEVAEGQVLTARLEDREVLRMRIK